MFPYVILFRYFLTNLSLLLILCLSVSVPYVFAQQSIIPNQTAHNWSYTEKKTLVNLSLEKLPPLATDPSNAVADKPSAAAIGYKLFYDTRLSAHGEVACATCHQPDRYFTDGLALAKGEGTTKRHSMSLVGASYNLWFFWDGRKDSQWSQALGPLESGVEHGTNRTRIAHLLSNDPVYQREYVSLFGEFPDISDLVRFPASAGPVDDPESRRAWESMSETDQKTINRIFANVGKMIAAYERLIKPAPAHFDQYIKAVVAEDLASMKAIYSDAEARGLHLFIGKAQCVNCHNGPLLTNYSFHNTGVPQNATDISNSENSQIVDSGRSGGVVSVTADPFNCLGEYSDASPNQCLQLRYMRTTGSSLSGAFKTPGLRNIASTSPYMHAGQFATLADVLNHYNKAYPVNGQATELSALNLTRAEMQDLEAFLLTLTGPLSLPELD